MKIKIILLVAVVLTILVSDSPFAADKPPPPEPNPMAAIESLGDDVLIANDQIEDLNSRFSDQIKISGYSDVEYKYSSKKGNKHGFRLHHLSLFFQKSFAVKWRFFSEIEYEDGPNFESDGSTVSVPTTDGESDVSVFEDAKGKIVVEAVSITYLWNPKYSVRMGRFFAPAGIWSIDHFPSYIPTQERPLHIRNIFPQFVDGLVVFGSMSMMNVFMNYDVYFGNGENNTGSGDYNNNKAFGFRTSFLLPLFKRFEFGVSGYSDVLPDSTEKLSVGAHLKAKVSEVTIQSESAWGEMKQSGTSVSFGAYLQAYYEYLNWTFGFRYDYFTPVRSEENGQTVLSLFSNYHVNDSVVLKLESHEISSEDKTQESYRKAIASIVVYLGQ